MALSAALPVAAVAHDVAAIIENLPQSPLQITDCRTSRTPAFLRVSSDFVNVSEKTVTDVRFSFRAIDRSGASAGSATANRLGTFAPRVEVDDTNGAVRPLAADVAHVICSVQMVRFDDDSIWRPPSRAP